MRKVKQKEMRKKDTVKLSHSKSSNDDESRCDVSRYDDSRYIRIPQPLDPDEDDEACFETSLETPKTLSSEVGARASQSQPQPRPRRIQQKASDAASQDHPARNQNHSGHSDHSVACLIEESQGVGAASGAASCASLFEDGHQDVGAGGNGSDSGGSNGSDSGGSSNEPKDEPPPTPASKPMSLDVFDAFRFGASSKPAVKPAGRNKHDSQAASSESHVYKRKKHLSQNNRNQVDPKIAKKTKRRKKDRLEEDVDVTELRRREIQKWSPLRQFDLPYESIKFQILVGAILSKQTQFPIVLKAVQVMKDQKELSSDGKALTAVSLICHLNVRKCVSCYLTYRTTIGTHVVLR